MFSTRTTIVDPVKTIRHKSVNVFEQTAVQKIVPYASKWLPSTWLQNCLASFLVPPQYIGTGGGVKRGAIAPSLRPQIILSVIRKMNTCTIIAKSSWITTAILF